MSITKQVATRTALLAVVAALGISIAAPVVAQAAPRRLTNQDRSVTSTEVKRALQNTSGVLETSTNTKASADVDSALVTATAGATVDVPKDARRGVRLAGKDGSSLSVGLPNASSASSATQVANGVVSYPSSNGSANAVQTNADGSVRMLTVIDNPNAPTRYDYVIALPENGSMKVNPDKSVSVFDHQGIEIARIAVPWAKDALGKEVATEYTVKGNVLSQYVIHKASSVTYPVTADPTVSLGWRIYVKLNRAETMYLAKRPNQSGFVYSLPGAAGCFKLGNGIIALSCGMYIAWRSAALMDTLDRAADSNRCVQVGLPYNVYNVHTFWTNIYSSTFSVVKC
jgi:hypothetical protein